MSFNNSRLRRINKILPQDTLRKIFTATSVLVMEYACTVWGSFSQHISSCIRRLENAGARAITGNDFIETRGDAL